MVPPPPIMVNRRRSMALHKLYEACNGINTTYLDLYGTPVVLWLGLPRIYFINEVFRNNTVCSCVSLSYARFGTCVENYHRVLEGCQWDLYVPTCAVPPVIIIKIKLKVFHRPRL